MATIIPFKGIRPAKDKVHLVASRSVDGYSTADLNEKLKNNPYTFLHVISPDFSDGKKTIPGSDERLLKVKSTYLKFRKEDIFVTDPQPSYYIYQQLKDGIVYTGIIGCSSIDDYFNGIIKIHEQTLTEREEKLKHYLEVCDFNAEPVLFSYPNDEVIDELTVKLIQSEPVYDFTTTDRVRHKLWIINNPTQVAQIQERFSKIPAVYIADGHHRSASSALLGKTRRKENPNYTGKEAFNFYLGIFFPETQLKIFDFNRVVKDLNGLSVKEFIDRLSEKFSITEKGEQLYKPVAKHNFSMYLEGKWYSLDAKKEIVHNEQPVGSLDASILTEHILSPKLNIHDLKTDKRIGFVAGIKGMKELKNLVDSGKYKVAFGLYPVEMSQLKHIADTNNIMPPKTTWVEPKMRSGLVIYSLSE
ncbi:MAG: DUF1015 domain-containing protein [Bacteroidota bacterium]